MNKEIKQKKAAELTKDEFIKMTQYGNLSDTLEDDILRAQIIGLNKNNKVMPGAIVRVPEGQIGENTVIGLYSYVNGDVTVGKNVLIGPHCSVTAGNHRFDPKTGWFSGRTEGIDDDGVTIGDGSWLASNVVVTGGVHIGKANLICAGAVVTKSTPDYAIFAGIPARQIGRIDPETGDYIWFSHRNGEEG